jgi:hypothetical protein
MENLCPEIKHILIKFLALLIITPIFGYGILLSMALLHKSKKEKTRLELLIYC